MIFITKYKYYISMYIQKDHIIIKIISYIIQKEININY